MLPAIAFWVRAAIRGRPDVVSGKLRAAEAAVAAGAEPPTAYPIWDGERGCWVDDAGKERPSTIPATVQPEQQPEPQPMMEQPPSQPRTPYAHTYTLGRGMPRVAHAPAMDAHGGATQITVASRISRLHRQWNPFALR